MYTCSYHREHAMYDTQCVPSFAWIHGGMQETDCWTTIHTCTYTIHTCTYIHTYIRDVPSSAWIHGGTQETDCWTTCTISSFVWYMAHAILLCMQYFLCMNCSVNNDQHLRELSDMKNISLSVQFIVLSKSDIQTALVCIDCSIQQWHTISHEKLYTSIVTWTLTSGPLVRCLASEWTVQGALAVPQGSWTAWGRLRLGKVYIAAILY